ncbi:uncharacterized protein METZ01_LOCUS394180, partial [marine metagenome]
VYDLVNRPLVLPLWISEIEEPIYNSTKACYNVAMMTLRLQD